MKHGGGGVVGTTPSQTPKVPPIVPKLWSPTGESGAPVFVVPGTEQKREVILCTCGAEVKGTQWDLRRHQREECGDRIVPCRNDGCTHLVRLAERAVHEKRRRACRAPGPGRAHHAAPWQGERAGA